MRHFNAGYNDASHTTKLERTGSNKLPGVAQRHPEAVVPTASERGAESKVAHKWARWLHNPCRLGAPHRFRAGA